MGGYEMNREQIYKKFTSLKRKYFFITATIFFTLLFTVIAFAEGDDPLTTINNLSTFVFSAIKAVGLIILGWGVVQIGLSLQNHDASQRSNGFLTFFGGLMIAFAKEILDLIIG